jgi:uncharacterized membrane protein
VRLFPSILPDVKPALRVVFALFFVGAGINHFLRTTFYLRMMPPYVPLHAAAVYVSGVAEIVLGLLLLLPATRVPAAWGIIALLVAVFPANLQMALHPETFPEFTPAALWLRLPFQPLMMAWAYWLTRGHDRKKPQGAQRFSEVRAGAATTTRLTDTRRTAESTTPIASDGGPS